MNALAGQMKNFPCGLIIVSILVNVILSVSIDDNREADRGLAARF